VAATLRDGLFYNGTKFVADRRVNWVGAFTNGPTYEVDDMSHEGAFLAICNTQTTDAIAPTAIGSPFDPISGATLVSDFQTLVVQTGNIFTFALGAAAAEALVKVPLLNIGLVHTVTTIRNGALQRTTTFTPQGTGDITIPIDVVFFFPGDVLEIHVEVVNSTGNTRVYWAEDEDYWLTYSDSVFSSVTGVKDSIGDDTAYGISMTVVQATVSEDWDIISSPAGASGSSDFTPDTFIGAGSTGYVPDPITETGKVLKDDGAWALADHGDLTGLADDDHTQYYNEARGDARYAQLIHDHDAGFF
jgi:hypothetical protein